MDIRLSAEEKVRRKSIADKTVKMLTMNLPIEESDETSLMLDWDGFYLQISFSSLHPLMVIYLARNLEKVHPAKRNDMLNELNLRSVLGSHAVNEQIGCYSYRSSMWLDTVLSRERFFEILNRCTEEAARGYATLAA